MPDALTIVRHNGVEPDSEGAFVYYDDHLAALTVAVAAERETWQPYVRHHQLCELESQFNQNPNRPCSCGLAALYVRTGPVT